MSTVNSDDEQTRHFLRKTEISAASERQKDSSASLRKNIGYIY